MYFLGLAWGSAKATVFLLGLVMQLLFGHTNIAPLTGWRDHRQNGDQVTVTINHASLTPVLLADGTTTAVFKPITVTDTGALASAETIQVVLLQSLLSYGFSNDKLQRIQCATMLIKRTKSRLCNRTDKIGLIVQVGKWSIIRLCINAVIGYTALLRMFAHPNLCKLSMGVSYMRNR